MGWIVFVVVLTLVISSLKKKWTEAKARNQTSGGVSARQPPALSKEQQVRQVRAEIQRKIQERLERGQTIPRAEPPRLPPVVAQSRNERREMRPAPQTATIPPPLPPTLDETLERQRVLAERIRELETRRQRAQENTVTAESLRWDSAPAKTQMSARMVQDELRDVQRVRRAVILREVLGTPVGLR